VEDALALFGSPTEEARRRLAEWMTAGEAADRSDGAAPPVAARDLEALIRSVCARSGVSEAGLREGDRAHAFTRARAIVCYLAVGELGLTARAVAQALGVTPGAVSQAVRRGEAWARKEGHVG
jgi:hypothetical protein